MFDERVDFVLGRLGGYGVQKYIVEPSDVVCAPILDKYTRTAQIKQWYANQRSIFECLNCDFYGELTQSLKYYYAQDSQFPPDIVKCCRLYSLLQEFNPSAILEIGCGTSSLVISKYLEDRNADLPSICVDANKDWIDCTRSKIDKDSSINVNNTEWIVWSDLECSKIKDLVVRSDKLFIYLDARLDNEDKLEGMGSLIKFLEGFSSNIAVLIDARHNAVLSLNRLASVLRCNLNVASNCLIPSRDEIGSAFHRYQHMGSFTYVTK